MFFKRERHPHPVKLDVSRHQKRPGFADLLNYLTLLEPDLVLHRDGSLSVHLRYIPPDLDAVTDEQLNWHSDSWHQALSQLGNDWMLEVNVLTHEITDKDSEPEFPELVSWLLEKERAVQCEHDHYFKTSYYLSMTWKPSGPISSFNFKQRHQIIPDEYVIMEFRETCNRIIGLLSKSLRIERLVSSELLSYLYQCISGEDRMLAMPAHGAPLNTLLANYDLVTSPSLQLNNRYIRVLALDGLPQWSYPNILATLSAFPVSYRWSTRYLAMDRQHAGSTLKQRERHWSTVAIGLWGILRDALGLSSKLDRDAMNMVSEIQQAQTLSHSGQRHYGYYNSHIVLMDTDPVKLEQVISQIMTHIQQLGYLVRLERLNATEAYLGSLPSHGGYNVRNLLVDTVYLSHSVPMSGVYQGESSAPCPYYGEHQAPLLLTETDGHRPFWLNLHVNDVGHTAILGPTGSGKSTLISAIISGHRRYLNSRVIVLDKDRSHQLFINALGGQYISLSETECQLSPFSAISEAEPASIDRAVDWLSDCCMVQGIDITPTRQRELRESVNRLVGEDPAYRNINHLSIQDPDMREALKTYSNGPFSRLLGGSQGMFEAHGILGIDMTELVDISQKSDDIRIPVIKAVLNDIEATFKDKMPTLLILEEAWLYLRHPLFKHKLRDWFKTLRKSNVSVLFVSQDLSDIARDSAASVIQNSCMTRIYLPNSAATQPAVKQFYEGFGLNEPQIEIIRDAVPKQDYYYQSPMGCRLFRLNLGDLAQSLMCNSRSEDIKAFHDIHSKEDPDWLVQWLLYKNQESWALYAKEQIEKGVYDV